MAAFTYFPYDINTDLINCISFNVLIDSVHGLTRFTGAVIAWPFAYFGASAKKT